ncbi:MAG: hypothetical protein ABIO91_07980 [Pyrinomonadaceae bacterium]
MRNLEKKRLDEIAKVLVKADAPSPRDIDGIIVNPALFDSVRARLKLVDGLVPRRFATRAIAGALAGIVLIAGVGLVLFVFRSRTAEVVVAPISEAHVPRETRKFTEPDKVAATNLPRTPAPPRIDRISAKPEIRISRPRQAAAQQIRYEGEGDFYALSYAGDPNETERGGRIVRIDLPRSTLFAMGVNVPLENESQAVKADLLIGSDGVTRAIRVVK